MLRLFDLHNRRHRQARLLSYFFTGPKIWHGQQYRQKGLEQLEEYLDSRNCANGYLVSFNFNEKKAYLQNKIVLEKSNKEIFEIIV